MKGDGKKKKKEVIYAKKLGRYETGLRLVQYDSQCHNIPYCPVLQTSYTIFISFFPPPSLLFSILVPPSFFMIDPKYTKTTQQPQSPQRRKSQRNPRSNPQYLPYIPQPNLLDLPPSPVRQLLSSSNYRLFDRLRWMGRRRVDRPGCNLSTLQCLLDLPICQLS
jgi:hypothetical protein